MSQLSGVGRRDGTVVDVHCHHLPLGIMEVDRRFRLASDETWGLSLFLGDRHLGPVPTELVELDLVKDDTECSGIGLRALCTASWMTLYWADLGLTREVARASNEHLAQISERSEGRLVPLAALPLQDMESAIEELHHATRELGAVGAAIGTNVGGVYYDDPRFEPFLAAAESLGVPLFLHPDDVAGSDRVNNYWMRMLIGNPHEATISLTRMILGGVLERFPKLQVCVPMGGGSIPLLLGRVEHGWTVRPEARRKALKRPSEYLQQLYFDTILHSRLGFEYLLQVVPPERIVMGSDYPWDMGETLDDVRERVEALAPGWGPAIFRDNALGLLGLDEIRASP